MTLREVKKEELGFLREMSISTFLAAFGSQNTPENMDSYLSEKMSLEHITSEYDHQDSTFYFVLIDDEIVGYLKLNVGGAQNEQHLGKSMEVERIYVIEEYQGKGIGQTLFEEVITMAKSQKMEVLWLGVWGQNVRAIAFYQRMGLEIFDSHSFMLGTDLQTDQLMKMHL
jgi:ribosomal protein S18 acetylase RimI-like enzyme